MFHTLEMPYQIEPYGYSSWNNLLPFWNANLWPCFLGLKRTQYDIIHLMFHNRFGSQMIRSSLSIFVLICLSALAIAFPHPASAEQFTVSRVKMKIDFAIPNAEVCFQIPKKMHDPKICSFVESLPEPPQDAVLAGFVLFNDTPVFFHATAEKDKQYRLKSLSQGNQLTAELEASLSDRKTVGSDPKLMLINSLQAIRLETVPIENGDDRPDMVTYELIGRYGFFTISFQSDAENFRNTKQVGYQVMSSARTLAITSPAVWDKHPPESDWSSYERLSLMSWKYLLFLVIIPAIYGLRKFKF